MKNSIAIFLLMTSTLASAGPKSPTAEDVLNSCQPDGGCMNAYLPDLYATDKEFRDTLLGKLKESSIKQPSWLPNGVTSLEAITIDGQRFLQGSFCQPHSCSNQVDILYEPKSHSLVGLYTPDLPSGQPGQAKWLGSPTNQQKTILSDLNNPQ